MELSLEELDELYLVRSTLEGLAAKLGASRFRPETLKKLAAILDAAQRAALQQRIDELLDLNREFHFSIYELAQKPLLVGLISDLWDRSDPYRRLYTQFPEYAHESVASHERILVACRNEDSSAIAQLVSQDILDAADHILSNFQNASNRNDV
jgi:DNA-binding GntR family transcriptional regulator